MTKPLISIIMPAYNAERYIAESIRSVLAQTYQNWELIIVDDGSTDRTAEIAQSFVLADSRVKYIFQQNTKVAAARNRGIGKAAGDLIAFLDSDDLWMPEKLERQEAAMRDGNMDVVFCSGFIFTGDDTTDESTPYPSIKGKFDGAAMFKLLLVEVANRIPVLSVIVRREALLDAGLFDESPALYYGAEDYDLWVRIARRGEVFYGMDERLVRYRVTRKG
jgi:teichuronic acid biosynthesis glycosyltransferase TuaG